MRATNNAWIVADAAYVDVRTPSQPHSIAIIDASDLPLIFGGAHGRWRAKPSRGGLYVVANTSEKAHVFLHRIVLGLPRARRPQVDHRNHDPLDNRRENLRVATSSQNNANRRKGGSPRLSRFKGVSFNRHMVKWQAQIGINGAVQYLGCFLEESDAARAYDARARELYGDFAHTNFQDRL